MNAAGAPSPGAQPWWRVHGVRLRLTLSYVGAMVVVLGVYMGLVYLFVNRNASEALNEQLRFDFSIIYANLYLDDFGEWMLNEPERLDPADFFVFSHKDARAVERARRRGVKRVDCKARLARARHAGDAGKGAERHGGGDAGQVVGAGAVNGELLAIALAA